MNACTPNDVSAVQSAAQLLHNALHFSHKANKTHKTIITIIITIFIAIIFTIIITFIIN